MTVNHKSKIEEIKKKVEELSEEILHVLMAYKPEVRSPTPSLNSKELTDCGYLLRETAKLADEIRKNAKAFEQATSRIICLKLIEKQLKYPSAKLIVRGELASATPDIRYVPASLKFGTEEFDKVCDYFEVPRRAREVMSFDYKRASSFLINAAMDGLNVPLDLRNPVGTEYNVIYRKKPK